MCTTNEKASGVGSTEGPHSTITTQTILNQIDGALKPEKKWHRVLRRLVDGPLDRFEAEKYPISDHVLPTTISELKKRDLIIHAQLVCKAGFGNAGVHIAEYRLAQESRAKALALLGANE